MPFKIRTAATLAMLTLALPAFAGDMIKVMHPYARAASPNAKTGAAFMMLMNHGDTDDRLIAATSDVAKKVELHTHIENADGVMQMRHDPDGFEIPAGGGHALQRGGDHVMFMGLKAPLEQDTEITVTLTFEKAGDMEVKIPVDHTRKPKHGAMSH